MAEQRQQFTFYSSYLDAIEDIPKTYQLDILLAICRYALRNSEPVKLSPVASAVFKLVKPTLDAGRKKAASGKQGGSKTKANRKQTETEKEVEIEKEKEVEIEIENECYISSSATAEEDNTAAAFDRFWDLYPNQIAREDARKTFFSICSSLDDTQRILSGLERWKRSLEWEKDNGKYIPRPANWLKDRRWMEHPKETIPKGASGQLGKAELEAISKMLEKEEKYV